MLFFCSLVAFAFPLNAPPVVTSGGNGSKEKGLNLRQDRLQLDPNGFPDFARPVSRKLALPGRIALGSDPDFSRVLSGLRKDFLRLTGGVCRGQRVRARRVVRSHGRFDRADLTG